MSDREVAACAPVPLNADGFNAAAALPYGVTTEHVRRAMQDFLDFLAFINAQLHTRHIERIESFLMAANFSSVVGEFMATTIPKYCATVARNRYHNGHPDISPAGRYPGDSVQYAPEGIEIKASRYGKAWQGHNREDVWLMVFVFDANGPGDAGLGIEPRPFSFAKVVGGLLTKSDWKFSGRSATSRRTITASVTESGFAKLEANWIYRARTDEPVPSRRRRPRPPA